MQNKKEDGKMGKNDMGSLEKEFRKRVEVHKYEIIASALVLYEHEGIYNHYLLKKEYGDNVMQNNGYDRAFQVVEELQEKAINGEQELYDKIYNMCWRKINKVIRDDKAYNLNNTDLQEY